MNEPSGRRAAVTLAAGIVLIVAAQLLAPVAAPLFDSLTVLGPYRYLSPAGNQTGAPTSATVTEPLVNGTSPGVNAATTESPPQAQLIATPDAFQLGPASTSITVTITPVPPVAPSTVGAFLGNTYRYTVTDQAGLALVTKPGTRVTLVMRAPDATSDAVMVQYAGGSWNLVGSSPSGTPGFFIGTVGTFGDFALVAAPSSGIGPLGVSLLIMLAAGVIGFVGYVVIRQRRQRDPAPGAAGGRRKAGPGGTRTPPNSSAKSTSRTTNRASPNTKRKRR